MVDVGHVRSRLETDLAGPVSSSDVDFPVTSTARFVAPCPVLVGHRDAWHDPTVDYAPEILLVTEVVDGTTLRTTLPNRGLSGTAVRAHDGTTGDLVVTAIFDQWHWEQLRDDLAGVARIQRGTYPGDGASNRDISLPFTPGFVSVSWVVGDVQRTAYSGAAVGEGVRGLYAEHGSILAANASFARPELRTDAFRVSVWGGAGAGLNASGVTYTYTAIGGG